VARLTPEKGIHHALEALAVVRREQPDVDIRYRIVGGGPLESSLRTVAPTTRTGRSGRVHGAARSGRRSNCAVGGGSFPIASVAEALPVSIMEAMACGLPVIATDVGSVAEMVKDGQTGRLVQPADPNALAGALRQMLHDRESWPRLGSAGRALIEQTYDIDVLNDRLVRHYQSLLTVNPCARDRMRNPLTSLARRVAALRSS